MLKNALKIALAAPAIHLGLCYYYLFMRSAGFGANISQFLSAGDVFTVGMSQLIATYLLVIGTFLFAHLWMDSDPLQFAGRQEFVLHPSLVKKPVSVLFDVMPYIAAAAFVLNIIFLDVAFLALIPIIVALLIARPLNLLFMKNNFALIFKPPAMIGILSVILLTMTAYSEGFRLRHRERDFFQDLPTCANGHAVLFTVGKYFVGFGENDTRVLLNDDCEVLMRFADRRVLIDVF